MDKKIREIINKELKIKGLSIECHYASWRDGDLSYPSMQDKGDVLMIRSFAQMTLSHDECVRAAMRQFIEDERILRKIETDPNAQFIDCKEGAQEQGRQPSLKRQEERARTRMWS
jgi:hypothetical protein